MVIDENFAVVVHSDKLEPDEILREIKITEKNTSPRLRILIDDDEFIRFLRIPIVLSFVLGKVQKLDEIYENTVKKNPRI